jgi:hypothetical protein
MFFSIGTVRRENFSHFHWLGPFVVSTDAGWMEFKFDNHHVVYKGYADDAPLEQLLDQILDQQEPVLLGNFCVLDYDAVAKTIKILTDRYRSFPIYVDSGVQITNLTAQSYTAWTDSLIEINRDLSVKETKFDVTGDIDTSYVSAAQAIEQIDQILNAKTKRFVEHNKLPVRVHLSGGVDSLLVYSYLQKYTDNYELVKCAHIDYDEFWLKNSGTLKKNFWGYSQIHHWLEPCVLTSGAPGDEFMLRSPTTVDLFLKLQGYDMIDLLNQSAWQTCLHQTYFSLGKHLDIFKNQSKPDWNRAQMIWNLCNMVVNDWQHWHLGNTITWTPLRDLTIAKILFQLPADQALGQIMNSDISCALIEKNCNGLSKAISDQKNSGNPMKNLVNFYSNITDKSLQ